MLGANFLLYRLACHIFTRALLRVWGLFGLGSVPKTAARAHRLGLAARAGSCGGLGGGGGVGRGSRRLSFGRQVPQEERERWAACMISCAP